jgi:predicted nucleic acid-binding protein
VTVGYLVDKSALARWELPAVAAVLEPALSAGLLWTCPPIELEVLYSCRNVEDYLALRGERTVAYRSADLETAVGCVAVELQEALVLTGALRSAGPIDLLIAAVAIDRGLTVLHFDADFETLSRADARLSQQWVVPRGSLPW